MDKRDANVPQQIAEVASVFQRQRTDHTVTLAAVVLPAELSHGRNPCGSGLGCER